jgi:hypothetical protein
MIMEQVFTIHKMQRVIEKKKTIWALESQNGNEADNVESSSRPKALLNFCKKHPSGEYRITTPSQKIYILCYIGETWRLFPKGEGGVSTHSSLKRALTALQESYLTHIEQFQIAIPENEESR